MEVHSDIPSLLLTFSLISVKVAPLSVLFFTKISSLSSGRTPCQARYTSLPLSVAATSAFRVFFSVRVLAAGKLAPLSRLDV
jgi:hypothetical protein